MRGGWGVGVAVGMMALGAGACVGQDGGFTAGMKALGAASGAIGKAGAKPGVETTRAAERMGGVYEQLIEFWRQRKAPDAVKLSMEGKAAAVALASASHAGEGEKAAAAFATLTGTCQPCHEKHRVQGPDGSYRIKPPVEE